MPEAYKNILIIKPSSLGDIVLALPALTALRKSFPDAEISWLVRPEFAPLLQNHPHLTRTIPFDRKFLGKAWFNPVALGSLLSLVRQLHRSRFDAVFDFQGLFRTASLGWLSGCKKRFGMANARELAHVFYTHRIPQDRDCIHLVDYYLKMVTTAGASNVDAEFVLPQDPAAVDSVKKLLANYRVPLDSYAVFVPGSTRHHKCWPLERFAALAQKMSPAFNLSIVATGTASELGLIDGLKALAAVPIVNLAGKTSLSELAALLKSARLVVTNDTGPGHIAAALGVPLVMMFGNVNPARLAPYKRPDCVVAVGPWDRPFEIRTPDPKYDINNITIEDVYKKVCEQMKRGSAGR